MTFSQALDTGLLNDVGIKVGDWKEDVDRTLRYLRLEWKQNVAVVTRYASHREPYSIKVNTGRGIKTYLHDEWEDAVKHLRRRTCVGGEVEYTEDWTDQSGLCYWNDLEIKDPTMKETAKDSFADPRLSQILVDQWQDITAEEDGIRPLLSALKNVKNHGTRTKSALYMFDYRQTFLLCRLIGTERRYYLKGAKLTENLDVSYKDYILSQFLGTNLGLGAGKLEFK